MERTDHQISVRVTSCLHKPLYIGCSAVFSAGRPVRTPSPPRVPNKTLSEYEEAEGDSVPGMLSSCNLAGQEQSRGGWKMSSRLHLRSQPGQQRLSALARIVNSSRMHREPGSERGSAARSARPGPAALPAAPGGRDAPGPLPRRAGYLGNVN